MNTALAYIDYCNVLGFCHYKVFEDFYSLQQNSSCHRQDNKHNVLTSDLPCIIWNRKSVVSQSSLLLLSIIYYSNNNLYTHWITGFGSWRED